MRSRALIWVGGSALLLMLAAGCGGADRTFRIGVLTDCQGPFHWAEDTELAGAELPLLRHGARLAGKEPSGGVTPAAVAGRQVELVRGCNESAERAVYVDEARRLVEREHVDALIGAAPIAAREVARLYPDVPFLATSWEEQETTLRTPARNLYRLNPDYGQQAAGLGAYAYKTLGWRHASIVAGNQPAGWGGAAGFVAEFCALGGKIDRQVLRDPYTPQPDADLAARAVAAASDGVATFLTDYDSALAVIGALADRIDKPSQHLLLWDQQFPALIPPKLAKRLDGVALTSRWPAGPPTRALSAYRTRFRAAFPRWAGWEQAPFVVEYAGAVEALLVALDRADGDLSDGRQRLRDELSRIRLVLPQGDARLDANRQLVTDVPLVRLRWRNGAAVTEPAAVVRDVEQTFGGLLSKAPPPGPASQPCRKATPPSWAH